METALTIFTWAMWIFIGLAIIGCCLGVYYESHYRDRKYRKVTIIISGIIFVITIVRLVLASSLHVETPSDIIYVIIWGSTTILQAGVFFNRKDDDTRRY